VKFIIILFFSLSVALQAQNNACKKWKNGIFITYPAEGKSNIIIRKGSQQLEYNGVTGEKEELVVKWIDPCTYELRRKKKNSKSKRLCPDITVTVNIVESFERHCLVFISSNLPGDVGHFDCMYMGPDPKKNMQP
jgi:hypothetical protein